MLRVKCITSWRVCQFDIKSNIFPVCHKHFEWKSLNISCIYKPHYQRIYLSQLGQIAGPGELDLLHLVDPNRIWVNLTRGDTNLVMWYTVKIHKTWWRQQMETFSALLAICAGNSPVTGEFPAQKPVTRSFDVFFDLRLNKRLSKQWWGWWYETPSRLLWSHCNDDEQERHWFVFDDAWLYIRFRCALSQIVHIIFLRRYIASNNRNSSYFAPVMGLSFIVLLSLEFFITTTSQWVRWRLKSPASRLFTQTFIQAQIKENTRHWPLCGAFTGDRWIPRTKGQ